MGLIKFLMYVLFKLIVYGGAFLILAWLLLGITPKEAWQKSTYNVGNIWGRLTGSANVIVQTAGDMKHAAEYQLQQASDRIDGKDPYEDFNNQLTKQMQQDIN